MSAKVAIVGRPNVGKSTLFNRLVGKRLALVDDQPGVTRDRREGAARLGHLSFTLLDTAGLEEVSGDVLEARMRAQTEAAIAEADLVLFLIDARAGVTPTDEHFAEVMRQSGVPFILVANKAEGAKGDAGYYDAFRLGLGEPVALSAEHGEGLGDLVAAMEPLLEAAGAGPPESADGTEEPQDDDAAPDPMRPLSLAIVGRPNVGKSTLINALIGEERMLTGPEAGITRDSIAIPWTWNGVEVRLHDTAGMRRKAKVTDKLEKLSVADTIRALRFAEVVVLMLEPEAAFEKQDLQIAELAVNEGRALVIAINKWDTVEDRQETLGILKEKLARLLPQVRGVPLVTISAELGQGFDRLLKKVLETREIWSARVGTGELNRWLADVTAHHPPPAVSGRRVRLRYMTQVKSRPPTFALFTSRPDAVPDSYRRYLVNELRDAFGLEGVPLRLHLRKQDNPYAKG